MSETARIGLGLAHTLVTEIVERLAPHVAKLAVAGSVRRSRLSIGDIEFVVAPLWVETDLFGALEPNLAGLKTAMCGLGTWVKGGERMMQVTDLLDHEGLKLEIYIVHPPAQWGSILAIRTGPAGLSQYAVTRMRDLGRQCKEGRIIATATGAVIATPTEEDFFTLAGMVCLPPQGRDKQLEDLTPDGGGR